MANRRDNPTIAGAWALEEDVESLRSYYGQWAASYDNDVAAERYFAPKVAFDLLRAHLSESAFQSARLLDAGCGTGLVGELLHQSGAAQIDGFDLSEDMVAQAREKSVYDRLWQGIDLTQPIAPQIEATEYDVVMCVGVLTSGHVPPVGFTHLLEVVRTGGLIVMNAREQYVQQYAFEAFCERLVAARQIRLHHCALAPSAGDSNALFLVAERL